MIRPAIAFSALVLLGAAKADPLAGYVAGAPQRCVVPDSNVGLTVLDANTLALRASPKRMWVTRPDQPCVVMHPTDTLIVERFGGSLCRGDRFRTISPGMSIPSGMCRIGMFVPYDKQKN